MSIQTRWKRYLWVWLSIGFYHLINIPACHHRGGVMLNFECVNIVKVPV